MPWRAKYLAWARGAGVKPGSDALRFDRRLSCDQCHGSNSNPNALSRPYGIVKPNVAALAVSQSNAFELSKSAVSGRVPGVAMSMARPVWCSLNPGAAFTRRMASMSLARSELLAEQIRLLADAAKAGNQQQLHAGECGGLLHLPPGARRRRREPLRFADDVRFYVLEIHRVGIGGAPRIAP